MKINNYDYLGQQVDISKYFYEIGHTYFNVHKMVEFDEKTLTGKIQFGRYERKGRMAFNLYTCPFEETRSWSFPPAYDDEPVYHLRFEFVESNVVRIKMEYGQKRQTESIMIEKIKSYEQYIVEKYDHYIELKTKDLKIKVMYDPFKITIQDENGKVLTETMAMGDGKSLLNCNPLPLSYVRTVNDMRKYSAVTFRIHADEHFYGGGESFTKLDKTGQKMVLWTKDANGVETQDMYKPIPFYMSSRGYGFFTHTTAPVTFDFGHSFQEAQTIFIGEDGFDLFFIKGKPKEILESYTDLTGRASMPPLWSFGLWMSRITYNSEEQVRDVMGKMQEYRIPCDVIHLDTGWFEYDWRCDYEFSKSRFVDPKKMIDDLKKAGYHVCLWQLPYFTPHNKYYNELIEKGYVISGSDGVVPTDDAILDFSNPKAVQWYQEKIAGLLELGVDAIKVDFGEAAPKDGRFYSGNSGMMEHNLYPLRYNKAVYDITKKYTDNPIIWARSAWAGSQRYPLHWGGDAENTDMGMLSSLRGGLSLGMCGFTFWSHDAGGFVKKSPEELYGRWMFMAIFSSHIRCHGEPPKEPWHYSTQFLELYRKQMELRYEILPYIYAQSKLSIQKGIPFLRTMFLEFPEDRNCYELETQFMCGDSILVAPLFEENMIEREVYLPEGQWIDLQNPENVYEGKQWHIIQKGDLEGIVLIKNGTLLPKVKVAQNTMKIDWQTLYYHWYTTEQKSFQGYYLNTENLEIQPFCEELFKKVKIVTD